MSDPVSDRYKEALRRGHVAVVKGRPKEGIEHYQEAASLAPDRSLPHTSIGSVYLQMGKPRDAARAFDDALERAPEDIDALRGKAQALEADGKREEAAAIVGRADTLQARSGPAPAPRPAGDPRLADIERHVQAGARARAMGDVRTAVMAYLAAANGYAGLDDFDAAIDACLSALAVQPGHIDVHFIMAMLYLRRGWVELGVQRVLLIDRRLDVDDDPRRRGALYALARDHRALSPELERLAATAS